MIVNIPKLNNLNEDKPILFFINKIRSILGEELIQIILFGSRARGDNSDDSDFDFLLILKYKNQDVIRKLRQIELEFMNEYDKLVACLVYDSLEWEKRKNLPIGKNIQREGITL